MAPPVTARFGKFRVLLGDDATPIAYSAPCGFTSKSLTFTKDLTDVNIPDCLDPDKIAWVGRDASSLSAAISGEGVAAVESAETWLEAFENVESVPVKVELEFPAKTITWTGAMQLSQLEIGAEQGGRVTLNVEMQSDGELVRTVTP
jgi:TP901-1 family phage major tail protein